LEAEEMTALGEAARQVPFRAAVGADGNLGSLTLEIPAAGGQPAYQYLVKYQDYGTAPKVSKPTGTARKHPTWDTEPKRPGSQGGSTRGRRPCRPQAVDVKLCVRDDFMIDEISRERLKRRCGGQAGGEAGRPPGKK
jgi:hypothetical protein